VTSPTAETPPPAAVPPTITLPPMPTRSPVSAPSPLSPLSAPAPLVGTAAPAVGRHDLPAQADAFEGLTRRVPRGEAPAETRPSAPVTASQRSPEEVRQMLSRYRSGLKRGRTEDEQTGSDPT
jgi:hypothetical protein